MSVMNAAGEKIDLPRQSQTAIEIIAQNWAGRKSARWRWVSMLILAQAGLTQRQIAQAFGTKQSTVSKGLRSVVNALTQDVDLQQLHQQHCPPGVA